MWDYIILNEQGNENHTDCEVWAVIQFLNTTNTQPDDINQDSVYGKDVMSEGNVRKYSWLLNESRTNICDEQRSVPLPHWRAQRANWQTHKAEPALHLAQA